MTIDRLVLALAGARVLASLALGLLVSPYWFWLTGFAGLNPVSIGSHQCLSAGDFSEEARAYAGRGVLLRIAAHEQCVGHSDSGGIGSRSAPLGFSGRLARRFLESPLPLHRALPAARQDPFTDFMSSPSLEGMPVG